MNILSRARASQDAAAFRTQALLVSSGSVAGQAITVLSAPVLARLYTPRDFGLMAVFFSLLALTAAIGTLRFEAAIPLTRSEERARALLILALLSTVVTALVVTALVVAFSRQIGNLTSAPAIAPLLWLLPLGTAGAGLHAAFTYWAVRHQLYGVVSRSRVAQPFTAALIQISGGLVGVGVFALLLGQALSRLAAAGVLARQVPLYMPRIDRRRCRHTFAVAAHSWRFPAFTTPATIINTASLQIPILLFSAAFGTFTLGLLTLTLRVVQLPMALVGQGISHVFVGHIRLGSRPIAELTLATFAGLLSIGASPYMVGAVLGPDLFVLAFGDEWESAGGYVAWLAPWLLASFVGQPITAIAHARGRQAHEVMFQTSLLLTRVASVSVAAAVDDALLGVQLLGVSGGIVWASYIAWLIRWSGASLARATAITLRESTIAVAIAVPVLVPRLLGAPDAGGYVPAALSVGAAIAYVSWKVGIYRLRKTARDGGASSASRS